VPDLPFTHDGLGPFLGSARINYLLGNIYRACSPPARANTKFQYAARQTSLEDGVWAWKASQTLPDFQPEAGKQKLEDLIQRARIASGSSSRTGWWLYNLAMLDQAAGRNERAQAEFRQALLSPDEMLSYHLTRLASGR
jgi:hypothetical protein